MGSTDVLRVIKRKIDNLEKIAEEVEQLGKRLFRDASVEESIEEPLTGQPSFASRRIFAPNPPRHQTFRSYHWGSLNDELKQLQREAIRKYQQYYSTASQLVK